MWPRANEMAEYLIAENDYGRELQISIVILGELQRALYAYGEPELAKKIEDDYNRHAANIQQLMD